jgi:RimJ/RimL family protein N-acetyltransferase
VLFVLYYLLMSEMHKPKQTQPKNLHNIPALQTIKVRDNIILRPLDTSDATQILGILNADPSIRDRVSVASKMYTPEDVASQIETCLKNDHLIRYAIVEDNAAIGLVSFWRDIDDPFNLPDSPDDYGFGYFLDPSKRSRGIVTDAIESVMDTATKSLGIKQFIAYCDDDNPNSISVLTKLGFKPTDIKLTEQSSGWVERKYIRKVS